MPCTSFLIIANPTSGRGRGLRTALAVAEMLKAKGLTAEIQQTTGKGDAERLVREACASGGEPPDCIVACGGDGTVHEVAGALAGLGAEGRAAPALGLAPAGRCNDFARALAVPAQPRRIAEILAAGEPRPVDLGRANGRYFCTIATVGIDAEISGFVDRMRLPLKGTPAYLYGAVRTLLKYRAQSVRISGDFGVVEQLAFVASVANTSTYGGALEIAPGALPTDGELDLCLIDELGRVQALSLLLAVLRGRLRSRPEACFRRVRSLRIEVEGGAEVWADGELIAAAPVDFSVAPGAVRVLLPEDFSG